jgi:hypothetical protein
MDKKLRNYPNSALFLTKPPDNLRGRRACYVTSLRTTNGSAASRPMWLPQ